jgi:hypothetical protein
MSGIRFSTRMLPDLDIWRAAQLTVKRHSESAAIQAGTRADELLAEGDLDGAAIWRAIIRRSRSCSGRRRGRARR